MFQPVRKQQANNRVTSLHLPTILCQRTVSTTNFIASEITKASKMANLQLPLSISALFVLVLYFGRPIVMVVLLLVLNHSYDCLLPSDKRERELE